MRDDEIPMINGRPMFWRLDEHHRVLPATRGEYVAMMSEAPSIQIARDEVEGVIVSTVFLGIDYAPFGGPPQFFETMVFGGLLDHHQKRYSTWDEAQGGHLAYVAMLRIQNALRARDR